MTSNTIWHICLLPRSAERKVRCLSFTLTMDLRCLSTPSSATKHQGQREKARNRAGDHCLTLCARRAAAAPLSPQLFTELRQLRVLLLLLLPLLLLLLLLLRAVVLVVCIARPC